MFVKDFFISTKVGLKKMEHLHQKETFSWDPYFRPKDGTIPKYFGINRRTKQYTVDTLGIYHVFNILHSYSLFSFFLRGTHKVHTISNLVQKMDRAYYSIDDFVAFWLKWLWMIWKDYKWVFVCHWSHFRSFGVI